MKHLRVKLAQTILRQPVLGLEKLPIDNRDLGFKSLRRWFGSYKPKHTRIRLNPLTHKTQVFNTCGWVSSVGAKEIDETVELDEQVLVMLGREKGRISGDGFSNLRDNEKTLQESGVAEKGLLGKVSWRNWNEYSDPKHLTQKIRDNARLHRTKAYSRLYNIDEIYKAIDEGRPVKIGVGWRTAFNMRDGFSFPWLLNFLVGLLVGGHAMYIYGYDTEYGSNSVFVIRNSFGQTWGTDGDCYIKEQDMQGEMSKYGAYTNEDIGADLTRWLHARQGMVVRTRENPDVYLIIGDKKFKYPDYPTLVAHGKTREMVVCVPAGYLDKVKRGDDLKFWDGGNIRQIKEMAQIFNEKDPLVLRQFQTYINELIK